MRTYLSIDLDYFNDLKPAYVEDKLRSIVRGMVKKDCAVIAVMNHQQLLNHVNESDARVLLHIDQHSDLGDVFTDKLNCGTWVSYVKWRKDGKFIWMHRHPVHYGECNGGDPIFTTRSIDTRNVDWKELERIRVKRFPPLKQLLKDVVAGGIVLSPNYSKENLEDGFRRIVKEFNLPYMKGWRSEWNARQLRPIPLSEVHRRKHANTNR